MVLLVLLSGRRGIRSIDVPRGRYTLDIDEVVVHARVLDPLAITHAHACATPDKAELRSLDPCGCISALEHANRNSEIRTRRDRVPVLI